MKYESVQQAREALKKLEQTQAAYNHALGVLYLDATTAAPSDTWEGRGKTMEVMSQITYDLLVNDENDELLSYLEAHADELDAQTKREVEVLRKSYDQIHRIPAEEYVAYSVLINDAESVWHKAKPEDDFAAFAPYLEKIVDYNRKFAGYYHPEMAPYDALLNEYEEGMNVETLDAFFAQLRQTIWQMTGQPFDSGFALEYEDPGDEADRRRFPVPPLSCGDSEKALRLSHGGHGH